MSDKRQDETLISIERAAERLGGVSTSSIRNWIRQGQLTRVKVGRRTMLYEREVCALIKPDQKGHKRNDSAATD